MNNRLTVMPPDKMDIDSLITWVKGRATESANVCEEGEQFYQRLKGHHNSIADLMGEMERLKKSENASKEDLEFIVDTVSDAIEAINSLVTGTPLEHALIETLEEEVYAGAQAEEIRKTYDAAAGKFLSAYLKHKARLGLNTQEEVSQITGLNRRQISSIENAKHKPQFKTIKRIADRFGVDITEFI